jgi:hypothetical protein
VSERREGRHQHLCECEVVAMEATWAHGSSMGERPLRGRKDTGAEEARRLLSLRPCTDASEGREKSARKKKRFRG